MKLIVHYFQPIFIGDFTARLLQALVDEKVVPSALSSAEKAVPAGATGSGFTGGEGAAGSGSI